VGRAVVRFLAVALPIAVASPAGRAEEPARAGATPGTKALDQRFAGKVVALKGKVLSLRYDFSSAKQLEDWPEGVPFPIDRTKVAPVAQWFDDKVELKGNAGVSHVGEWTGDIAVSCTLIPDTDKDAGAYLVPGNGSDDYATFTLAETYFHKWDAKPGGEHTILKFGKQWREAGSTADFVGFRYVDQRPPTTPVTPGTRFPATFGFVGGKLTFKVPDFDLKGNDLGNKMKTYRPGFYVVNGRLLVDDVVITGRLADAWLAKEKVELRTEKPIEAAGEVDAETKALVDRYAADGAAPEALVKLVGDASRPPAARAAAAQALARGPKKAVRPAIDLLYSSDLDTRAHGIGIVKALLGKDYGYSPKGNEEARSAAIQKINRDLAEHPGLLGG
jgi:hypothetical protein